MIKHIVLFGVEPDASQIQIDNFYTNLYKLKEKIPGILSVEGGKNISLENYTKCLTDGFIMTFSDKKSRDDYLLCEAHKKFVEKYVDPIFDDCVVYDFEF